MDTTMQHDKTKSSSLAANKAADVSKTQGEVVTLRKAGMLLPPDVRVNYDALRYMALRGVLKCVLTVKYPGNKRLRYMANPVVLAKELRRMRGVLFPAAV